MLELCRGGVLAGVIQHYAALAATATAPPERTLSATQEPVSAADRDVASSHRRGGQVGPGGGCPLSVARFYIAQVRSSVSLSVSSSCSVTAASDDAAAVSTPPDRRRSKLV